ncbi:MAG: flagellar protein FlaG [Glaciimonas sp.]|nr:flagellar protein FlaG [Glaciimonas sp.]
MAIEQIGSTAGASAPPLASVNARASVPATESPATLIGGAKAVQPTPATPSTDDVRDAVKKIEQVVTPAAQDLRFSVDQDTGTVVVKLIDTKTDTVLRQIPTVEVMEISKALGKLQGMLLRDKA